MQEISKIVWDFRNKYSKWWITPCLQDSLRYALTEIAEAMDAYLRGKRQNDLRNHGGDEDGVSDELADCAIMLVTAIPRPIEIGTIEHGDIDHIALQVAQALNAPTTNLAAFHVSVALAEIIAMFDAGQEDLVGKVQSRLRKIKKKIEAKRNASNN